MLLILLDDVFGVGIELEDFLVGTTSQENMLLIFSRMEFNAERCFAISETPNNFAGLGVPKLNDFVERCGEEFTTIVRKLNVSDGLGVAHISAKAFSVGQHVPDFDGAIVTST